MGRHVIAMLPLLQPLTSQLQLLIHHQYVALSQLSVLVWCTTQGNDCACAAATSGGAARRRWSWQQQCLLRERVSSHLFKWKAPIIITQSLDIAFLSTFFFPEPPPTPCKGKPAPFYALLFFMVKQVLEKLVFQYVMYLYILLQYFCRNFQHVGFIGVRSTKKEQHAMQATLSAILIGILVTMLIKILEELRIHLIFFQLI